MLKNKRILLDLSNGVTSQYAKEMFIRLGGDIKVINNKFDGNLINKLSFSSINNFFIAV